MTRFALLVLLLSPFYLTAQKRLNLVHDNAFVFYDYSTKSFCVLDDSTFLWKYDENKIKWQKTPLELSIDMPFAKFLYEFIPMSENGTPVYFVHGGCGVVFSLAKNRISRHDHSFYHRNQFGGTYFMDEGEPRIYGGYGLFTYKNFITRYDTIRREWFMIQSYSTSPPIGFKNVIQKNKKFYYLFDGFKSVYSNYKKNKDLWQFNIYTNKWRNLGKVNPAIIVKRLEFSDEQIQTQKYMYSCYNNMIFTFDFDKFKFKKYKIKSNLIFRKILKDGDLFLLLKSTKKQTNFVEISNDVFLKQLDFEEGDILIKKSTFLSDFKFIILFTIIILVVLGLFIFYKKSYLKNSKSYNSEKKLFKEFNETEKEFIHLLIYHSETGLEISFINDLVNQDQPSIDTLKKRRESLLKELRYKLATKFNLSQEDVFIEKRMNTDKRMKLLFLNEMIHKKYKNKFNSN